MERTLVLIKPDGIKRKLAGSVIQRFENKGLRICALKMLQVTKEMAEKHYAVHKDKPFFNDLVNYITSYPIMAMILEGRNAISVVRNLCGATDGSKAAPGTIRGDYSNSIQENIVHASDSEDSYKYE
ncbi:MAG: nucleoside-diphosphate kinase, partial [Candidatus Thermoplasmatota archaeon]|nr:nucleoside-diphosphate kinase [Candidatus Thermoplasmatota archaeon]